ncbi:MAG TPA: hypothetical protein VNZ86_12260, partial [Bacteroidia bacterium]|nr:hypothetical protein [Bacteroidia bacterium]
MKLLTLILTLVTVISYAGPPEQVKSNPMTGDIGVAFVSEYIDRGLVLENQGVIAQPYIDLAYRINDYVSLNLGLWSSIHSHVDPTTATVRNWY